MIIYFTGQQGWRRRQERNQEERRKKSIRTRKWSKPLIEIFHRQYYPFEGEKELTFLQFTSDSSKKWNKIRQSSCEKVSENW